MGFEPTTRDSIVFEAAALPSELVGKFSFSFAVKQYHDMFQMYAAGTINFKMFFRHDGKIDTSK